jgi:glycerate dehydrogenase
LATGYNVVDCQAAKERGIPVCNVPTYGTAAVAQFTFSLMLEICNAVGQHNDAVHRGDWASSPHFCFWNTPQMELAGKTLGIIGFGRIGRAVGRIAKAMGMDVIAYNRSRHPEGEEIGEYVELDTLFARSDVISLHCPLTAENAELINKDTIGKMKDGVILLNTARGGLLNEQDVADALCSGKLRYAAVDVVSKEPIDPCNPLLTAPNCIITPHMAWAPIESRLRLLDCTVQSIEGFLAGKPVNRVN